MDVFDYNRSVCNIGGCCSNGWSSHLFWLVIIAWLLGTVIEDYLWFVVNPAFPLKNFKPAFVWWHYWVGWGRFKVPEIYVLYPILALGIYIFLL